MKKIKTLILVITFLSKLSSQTFYPSLNISLLSVIDPEVSFSNPASWQQKYSGCWGWYQVSKNKEYAIIGSASGAYFIDVTNPLLPVVNDSVKVDNHAIHREIKTYSHYAYITTDEQGGRTCIVDLQYLPDSIHEIPSSTLPQRAHTLFIEGSHLYMELAELPPAAAPTASFVTGLAVYDLILPEAPTLLRYIEQDYASVSVGGCLAHDVFVNNDTIFASCQGNGLKIYRFTPTNTFSLMATYSNYIQAGYNHSSWLSEDRKHLVFCDEVPTGLSAKIIDVQNFSNIVLTDTFKSHAGATAHNPYIVGNRWCWLSSYEDGIYLYDISNPNQVSTYGFIDTRPAHGFNDGYPDDYQGNWGAYPFLPSKIVLTLDQQNGLFILDGDNTYKSSLVTSTFPSSNNAIELNVFPNPMGDNIEISAYTTDYLNLTYSLIDILGRTVFVGTLKNAKTNVNTEHLAPGLYHLSITNEKHTKLKTLKLIK
ncbi:MAG: choice-of-anchor B family protein [Bacteroidota bacterium]